jgi:magnesium chelatase family protein
MDVPRVEYEKLSDERLGEPSAAILARVEAARGRSSKLDFRWSQVRRFAGTGLLANADTRPCGAGARVGPAEKREYCP